jgi:hypothetical protein
MPGQLWPGPLRGVEPAGANNRAGDLTGLDRSGSRSDPVVHQGTAALVAAEEDERFGAAVIAVLLAGEGDAEDVKPGDTVKVTAISCPDAPSGRNGGRSDDPVVRPDVLRGSGEVGPDAGVRSSGQEVEGQRRKRGNDCLDEGLTTGAVLAGRPVHAIQQL